MVDVIALEGGNEEIVVLKHASKIVLLEARVIMELVCVIVDLQENFVNL
jgi:hypothetical protein